MEANMKCPICKQGALRAWKGTIELLGVAVSASGKRCDKCGETLFDEQETERQERELATALVERGIRTANEFRLVRKAAGFRANELAELLGVAAETVWRWEHGKVDIPRAVAFALGELFDRPRVTRAKLEAHARP